VKRIWVIYACGALLASVLALAAFGQTPSKEPGKKADHERPFVLRRGATVHELALHVHKDIAARLKYARLWGSARFDGQQVDREHVLNDRDVVELHA